MVEGFEQPLDRNLDRQIDRVFNLHKVSCILIDGELGGGKTTLGVHIVDYINDSRGLSKIELSQDCPQYAFGYRDFVSKIVRCSELGLPAIIYDEGGDFNSRAFLSRANKELNRVFETYRALKVIVIICLPLFYDLDSSLFKKKIVRMLIHLHNKKKNYVHYKVYGAYEVSLMRGVIKKYNNTEAGYMYIHPNFRGRAFDLEPARSRQLDRIGVTLKRREAQKASVTLEGLMCLKDISYKLAKNYRWVYNHLNELGIKPVKKIGKTQYYNEAVIEALSTLE